jgi:hypothetical protein
MGVFKGCWTFKVIFEIEVDALSENTEDKLYHECVKAIYANSPFSKEMREMHNDNFKVKIIQSDSEKDDSYESFDHLWEHRHKSGSLIKFKPTLDEDEKN